MLFQISFCLYLRFSDKIRQENSLAFSCGHYYCEICSKNLSYCSECGSAERKCGTIIEQSHADLLAIIEKLQTNFNVECV